MPDVLDAESSPPDPLRDWLRLADDHLTRGVEPSTSRTDWNGSTLRRRAQRRTAIRRASAAVVVVAALVGVAIVIGPRLGSRPVTDMPQTQGPAPKALTPIPTPEPTPALTPNPVLAADEEMRRLREEIQHQERILAHLKLAEAQKRIPDQSPILLSSEAEREGSAWLAVRWIEQSRNSPAANADALTQTRDRDRYLEVTQLFPDTQAAQLARRRLDEPQSM